MEREKEFDQYIVQQGDSLVSISLRENVSVAQLKRLNHLGYGQVGGVAGGAVFAGQKLNIRPKSLKVVMTDSVNTSITNIPLNAATVRNSSKDNEPVKAKIIVPAPTPDSYISVHIPSADKNRTDATFTRPSDVSRYSSQSQLQADRPASTSNVPANPTPTIPIPQTNRQQSFSLFSALGLTEPQPVFHSAHNSYDKAQYSSLLYQSGSLLSNDSMFGRNSDIDRQKESKQIDVTSSSSSRYAKDNDRSGKDDSIYKNNDEEDSDSDIDLDPAGQLINLTSQISVSPIVSMTSGIFSSIYGQAMSSLSGQFITNQPSHTPKITEPLPEQSSNYIPRMIGDAKILNLDIIRMFMTEIPHYLRSNDWILLYSMLGDGTDITTFYNNTRRNQSTLIFIQTLEGRIFGGFCDTKWHVNLHYYGTGENFVFRICPDGKSGRLETFQWTGLNDFYMWSTDEKIAMGGGNEGFAFVLDSNFITGETCRSATYGNPVLISTEDASAKSISFTVSNVEVWGFQPFFY